MIAKSSLAAQTCIGLLSVGFDKYGDEAELVRDPIMHLYHIYVRINRENQEEVERFNKGEITDGDSTIHAQAKKVFKAMEDGTSAYGEDSFELTILRRAKSHRTMVSVQGSFHRKAQGDIRALKYPL